MESFLTITQNPQAIKNYRFDNKKLHTINKNIPTNKSKAKRKTVFIGKIFIIFNRKRPNLFIFNELLKSKRRGHPPVEKWGKE